MNYQNLFFYFNSFIASSAAFLLAISSYSYLSMSASLSFVVVVVLMLSVLKLLIDDLSSNGAWNDLAYDLIDGACDCFDLILIESKFDCFSSSLRAFAYFACSIFERISVFFF